MRKGHGGVGIEIRGAEQRGAAFSEPSRSASPRSGEHQRRSKVWGISCAGLVLGLGAVASLNADAQPTSLNLQPTLAPVKAKLGLGQVANVLVIGDSLSVRQGSYLPFLTSALQSDYGNAGAGYQGFSLWTGAGFNSGWAKGMINQDTVPHRALDGLWSSFELPTSQYYSAYFTGRNSFLELHYLAQPGGGSATIAIPGMPSIVLNTNAAETSLQTLSYTAPGADKQVWIYPNKNGVVTILGQINRTGLPGISFHRAANGGWGVENFIQRDFTFDRQIERVNPDVVLMWIGQNDQIYDRVTYVPRLNILIDRVRAAAPNVPILMIGTYNSGSPRILPLVQAVADVAEARGLGFIDLYHVAGTYEFFEFMGYLDDGLHFSDVGGQHIANLLYHAWHTDGASLELCAADVNRDTTVDLGDFFTFFNAWDQTSPVAEVDGIEGVDLGDFFEFLSAFDAGC